MRHWPTNILKSKGLSKILDWWGIVVKGQLKLAQWQKHTKTTLKMIKDGGVSNEWWKSQGATMRVSKRQVGNTLRGA
jgi:hypothetical protein